MNRSTIQLSTDPAQRRRTGRIAGACVAALAPALVAGAFVAPAFAQDGTSSPAAVLEAGPAPVEAPEADRDALADDVDPSPAIQAEEEAAIESAEWSAFDACMLENGILDIEADSEALHEGDGDPTSAELDAVSNRYDILENACLDLMPTEAQAETEAIRAYEQCLLENAYDQVEVGAAATEADLVQAMAIEDGCEDLLPAEKMSVEPVEGSDEPTVEPGE